MLWLWRSVPNFITAVNLHFRLQLPSIHPLYRNSPQQSICHLCSMARSAKIPVMQLAQHLTDVCSMLARLSERFSQGIAITMQKLFWAALIARYNTYAATIDIVLTCLYIRQWVRPASAASWAAHVALLFVRHCIITQSSLDGRAKWKACSQVSESI